MAEFLNKFAAKYRNPKPEFMLLAREEFQAAVDLVYLALREKALRPERALNAAVFDSVMVGVTERQSIRVFDPQDFKNAYEKLLKDVNYVAAVSKATSNEKTVEMRQDKAKQYMMRA